MARGRRPDTPEQQAAKGHPRKQRKRPAPTDLPAASGLQPPKSLAAEARALWRELAPELERNRFLRGTDGYAFARYCDALERWLTVAAALRAEGETYLSTSAHGDLRRINPKFLIEERLVKRLESLEDRFGMNPLARQQMLLRMAQTGAQGAFELTSPTPETARPSPIGILAQPAPTQH